MGAGTSIGSSVASVNIQRSDTGRKHGKTRQQAQGDELDQASASSLADKYQMKSEEVMLLWKRFHQLGPDKNGHVHRSVFANNSIYTSTFCKQVWGRMGQEGNVELITFDKFLTSMKHFQYDDNDDKLKRYFGWMAENDRLTKERLKYVINHAFPDASDEEVASKVNVVMEVMDPQQRGYITIEHFMTFMHTISEEQLSKALSFTILPIGGLQSEQDSVRSDDS
ncbi:uncharacterized protein [Dysidea avara]|uniref:uncharacterized protein n=1 Tax=Dysidea avara TaxID=196820 RepID=UPI003333E8EF